MGKRLRTKTVFQKQFMSIYAQKSQSDLSDLAEKARWEDFDRRIDIERADVQECYSSQNDNYTTQILWISAGVLSLLFLRTFQAEQLQWTLTWAMVCFAGTIVFNVFGYVFSEYALKAQLTYIGAYQSGNAEKETKYRKIHWVLNQFNKKLSFVSVVVFILGFVMLGVYVFR